MEIHKPPQLYNHLGKPRKIGYELEFSGLEIREIVDIVCSRYPGEVIQHNPYKYEIQHEAYGSFMVEMDAYLLNEMVIHGFLEDIGIRYEDGSSLREKLDKVIKNVAETVVPYEVSTPPLTLDKLPDVERLKRELRMAGAKGTGHSMFYAFGLQLNPDVPSLETGHILSVLRAYLLLHYWLRKKLKVDFTRKITPFINSFPRNYVQLVLDHSYNPDREQFINDYIHFNETRNRPLDLLPLLVFIDPHLKDRLKETKINARPAYHYRLPNSKVSLESWNIGKEWNYWVKVEELANESEALDALSRDYLNFMKDPLYLRREWINHIDQWVKRKETNLL